MNTPVTWTSNAEVENASSRTGRSPFSAALRRSNPSPKPCGGKRPNRSRRIAFVNKKEWIRTGQISRMALKRYCARKLGAYAYPILSANWQRRITSVVVIDLVNQKS